MIPIYNQSRELMQYVTETALAANAGHFDIVTNRRGHPKRAYVKPGLFDNRKFSRLGMAFEQSLSTGNVWALGGVIGSRA